MDIRKLLNLFECQRKSINENLRNIGLSPLPNDIYLYDDVIKYLNNLKKDFESEIDELNVKKTSYEKEGNGFGIEKELRIKINGINDTIKEVERDMKCLQIYHDTFEQNKEIRDTSDLNEYLMDFSNINVNITEAEKQIFSNLISALLLIKKNAAHGFLKVRDYSTFKEAIRIQWNKMKIHPAIPELVKNSIFRTYETIDAILV